jgi:hypothetical protein
MPNDSLSEFAALRSTVNLFTAYSNLVELAEDYGLSACFEAEVIYTRSTEAQPSLKNLLAKYRNLANINKTDELFLEYPLEEVATEPYSSISAAVAEATTLHPNISPSQFMGKLAGPLKHYYNSRYPESGISPDMPAEVTQMLANVQKLCDRTRNNQHVKVGLADCSICYNVESKILQINEEKLKFTGLYDAQILTELFKYPSGESVPDDVLADVLSLSWAEQDRPTSIRAIRDSVRGINERIERMVPTDDKLISVKNREYYRNYGTQNGDTQVTHQPN